MTLSKTGKRNRERDISRNGEVEQLSSDVEARLVETEDGRKIEEEGRMSVRWETEGLQTVGIVCLVIMFLKLMHLLGLIDITETGEATTQGNRGAEPGQEGRTGEMTALIQRER